MTITTTGLATISLVCVPTIEQDTAIAFYESLGFEKRTDQPFGGGYRWIEVYPPEGTTGIALAPPPADSGPVQPGNTDAGVLASGQVAGIVEDLPSCAELIESIVAEAVKHLQAASALVQD